MQGSIQLYEPLAANVIYPCPELGVDLY